MKESNIDFRQLFKSVPGLYLILSPELKIIAVNNAYANATMTKRDEIVGRGLFEVFPDNPNDENANGVSNLSGSLNFVIKNKKAHTMAVQKYDIQKPDGAFEERYWSPLNIPVLNSQNELEYIIHRVEDVTEFISIKNEQIKIESITSGLQKKVNDMEVEIVKRSREIQQMNAELEQKVKERTETLLKREMTLASQNKKLQTQNKELEQFTYVASHDLQEPLRSLINFTELLKKEFSGKLDENADIYINFISKSSQRMQDLVKGLLDYSRIGKEKELTEVDCNKIISDVLSDMTVSIKECNAKVTVSKMPVLKAYDTELRQLFQNFISNAIKFRKKNVSPEITISVKEQSAGWLFSIQDNGIGIDEKNKDKLFIIFKRLHNRNEYEGTGIGLANCKKILELHDGNIWVDSKLGEGSTFNFTIPKL